MHADLNGTHLHWRETGSGTDRVLVLIHGFPFHSGMWAPQLDAPPDGWRLIAPDLRGFGDSVRGAQPLTMDLLAQDVAALLAHLHVGRAVVCGLSMGGYVTFSLLRRHPALVRALVLCDTRAEPDSAEARQGRSTMAARVRNEGIAPLVDAMLPRVLGPLSRGGPAEARVRELMEATAPESAAAALLGMGARPDSSPMLRSITVPTAVIVGADDVITPAGEARLMARAIPGSIIEVIPEAGHVPNLEQTGYFNSALDRFLRALG